MTDDYSSYGNFISKEQPIDLRNSFSPGWSSYINPFFKSFYDPVNDTPWESWITIQPEFDFQKEGKERYHLTFVLQVRGHNFDKTVEFEIEGEKKERISKNHWHIKLDIRVQHFNDERITYMKKAKNSLGLKRVHDFLLKSDFYDRILDVFPDFNNFSGTGKSEYNGKGFQLGAWSYEDKRFEQINNEFVRIQNFITDFSQSCDAIAKPVENAQNWWNDDDFDILA
tara:strand:- start:139 stop:816 length:678 start_codon:yes stop_codon:yes gene_type:complete